MCTESSVLYSFGDTARLISPTLTATNGRCLHFFYYMRGENSGALNVYEKLDNQIHTPIWTLTGVQFNKWMPAQVTLVSPMDFQVSSQKSVSQFQHFIHFIKVQSSLFDTYLAMEDVHRHETMLMLINFKIVT